MNTAELKIQLFEDTDIVTASFENGRYYRFSGFTDSTSGNAIATLLDANGNPTSTTISLQDYFQNKDSKAFGIYLSDTVDTKKGNLFNALKKDSKGQAVNNANWNGVFAFDAESFTFTFIKQ